VPYFTSLRSVTLRIKSVGSLRNVVLHGSIEIVRLSECVLLTLPDAVPDKVLEVESDSESVVDVVCDDVVVTSLVMVGVELAECDALRDCEAPWVNVSLATVRVRSALELRESLDRFDMLADRNSCERLLVRLSETTTVFV
jgi:hypothetical protein